MSYCCPTDPKIKKEWEEKMLQEIDVLDKDIKKASEIFSALGHPIRLKITYFLSQRDHCVCELIFKLNERQNLVSHHITTVSYTHLRAHETDSYLVCRLLLEKKKK